MVVLAIVLGGAMAYLCFGIRFRCRGLTNRSTLCKNHPRGLLGRCRDHGRWARLAHFAGARKLDEREKCRCGKLRVLRRNGSTGVLFLGCAGYPGCKLTVKL